MSTPLGRMSAAELDEFERLLQSPDGPIDDTMVDELSRAMGLPKAQQSTSLTAEQWRDKLAAEVSLAEFQRQAWHVVEPDVEYIDGWHIHGIARHLEALVWDESGVRNLLINEPPGCMKSLLCGVFLVPWAWIHKPSLRFLYASYEASLSTRDSMRCRQVLQSPWYRARWGHRFQLIGDQNEKTRYENDQRGWRMSTSVGGRGTGEHPDVIVADDPHKAQEIHSEAERHAVIDWWDGTISSRGRVRGSRRLIVMQRLHQEDLSGHVLSGQDRLEGEDASEQAAWVHICLPMRYEPNRMPVTPLGWTDPRTEPGELLWPAAFSEAKVREIEIDMGSLRAAGQLQQRPTPMGGHVFRPEWFEIVPTAPAKARRVRYWDKAGTQGGGAYTSGCRMALDAEGTFYIEGVRRAQVGAFRRNQMIKQTADMDANETRNTCEIWLEQEPGSGGKESGIISVKQLRGFPVFLDRVTGDKVSRAMPLAAQAEAGNVKLVAGPWIREFLDELAAFPHGTYKDQVDSASGALNKLAAAGRPPLQVDEILASGDPAHRDEEHRAFTAEEINELPDFLQELMLQTRASASERNQER